MVIQIEVVRKNTAATPPSVTAFCTYRGKLTQQFVPKHHVFSGYVCCYQQASGNVFWFVTKYEALFSCLYGTKCLQNHYEI
jgi:hypothetical protein